jgi:hypothetical protein
MNLDFNTKEMLKSEAQKHIANNFNSNILKTKCLEFYSA